MVKYRPQILWFLSWGMGDAVGVGILYMFNLYAPDLLSGMRPSIGWLGFLLSWWIGGAFVVVCFGPIKKYAAERKTRRE